ncbi:23S ribosomal RNA methyltransferase Erm [Oceanobacillus sp. FSL W8-0428]|uniref:23S ribosomal RNA methyltransferase Erm n=1 Tax=Oceanobacillus sp. FSL W8-0428 TaxID=2921715 RepID=UPI0030FC9660
MAKKFHKYNTKSPNFSGQHLIHNKKLLHEIVDRANISKKDTVLELGAGKGALTTVLNQQAGKVLAVEYDTNFIDILKRKTAENPVTKIIHQDIMKIHLPKEKFVVVSNIPYAITTPIMKMLLNKPANGFQKGVIIMEMGAAKRFTSQFVKDDYVLAWRMWFDICYIRKISRNNFSPPPKVDSAMITITRKKEPIIPKKDYFIFLGLVQYSLKQPEAAIGKAFKRIFTPAQLKYVRRNLRVTNDTPIGLLTEVQWGIVFNTMIKYVQRPLWPRVKK